MEYTWTVPVAIIMGGSAYAIIARYFTFKERLAASAHSATFEELESRVTALEYR